MKKGLIIPLALMLVGCKKTETTNLGNSDRSYKVEWVINGKVVEIDNNVTNGSKPIFNGVESQDFVFISDESNHINMTLRKDLISWSEEENATSGKVLSELPTVSKDTKYYAVLEKSDGKLVSEISSTYAVKYTDSNNSTVFLNWQEVNKNAVKPEKGSESTYNYESNGFNIYAKNNCFYITNSFLETLGTNIEIIIPSIDPILGEKITTYSFSVGNGFKKIKSIVYLPSYKESGDVSINGCNSLSSLEKVYVGQYVNSIVDGAFQANTYINNITYFGTKEQFKKIKRGYNWLGSGKTGTHGDTVSSNNTKASVIHCIDGNLDIDDSIIQPNK